MSSDLAHSLSIIKIALDEKNYEKAISVGEAQQQTHSTSTQLYILLCVTSIDFQVNSNVKNIDQRPTSDKVSMVRPLNWLKKPLQLLIREERERRLPMVN